MVRFIFCSRYFRCELILCQRREEGTLDRDRSLNSERKVAIKGLSILQKCSSNPDGRTETLRLKDDVEESKCRPYTDNS